MLFNKITWYILFGGLIFVPAITSESITYAFDAYSNETGPTNGINCTRPGKTCDGCYTVSYCIELPDGSWIKEELYNCTKAFTCLDSISDCTYESNPTCDANVINYNFTCHQLGIFPDPFDCTKYHMCLPSVEGSIVPSAMAASFKCGLGYSYDPLSTLCKVKMVNGTCQPFAPACTTAGQAGKIAGNPSMYYICLKDDVSGNRFPHLFLCPFNQEFNGDKCVDPTPPNGIDDDGKCTQEGYFFDSLSCKNYMECTDKGVVPTRRSCDTGRKFDYKEQKCVLFDCN